MTNKLSRITKRLIAAIAGMFRSRVGRNRHGGVSFFGFMEDTISRLGQLGRTRTSETYAAALNSFRRFRHGADLHPSDISSDMMEEYEAYLRSRGVTPNTISFYNRILRAAYNRAVDKRLTPQRLPFRNVYTGMEKTAKRAIPPNAIRAIMRLNLARQPALELARDLFMFSFYTRGMSFVDMAYLRKCDLSNGTLSYRRRQRLFVAGQFHSHTANGNAQGARCTYN